MPEQNKEKLNSAFKGPIIIYSSSYMSDFHETAFSIHSSRVSFKNKMKYKCDTDRNNANLLVQLIFPTANDTAFSIISQ